MDRIGGLIPTPLPHPQAPPTLPPAFPAPPRQIHQRIARNPKKSHNHIRHPMRRDTKDYEQDFGRKLREGARYRRRGTTPFPRITPPSLTRTRFPPNTDSVTFRHKVYVMRLTTSDIGGNNGYRSALSQIKVVAESSVIIGSQGSIRDAKRIDANPHRISVDSTAMNA